MPTRSMSRYVSFGVLIAVIIMLTVLFYFVMKGFFVPLFLAALLVVVFRPLHERMLKWCKGREKTAALLTTASVMLAVLIPITFLFVMAVGEGREAVRGLDAVELKNKLLQVRRKLHLEVPEIDEFNDIERRFANDLRVALVNKADVWKYQVPLEHIEQDARQIWEKNSNKFGEERHELAWPVPADATIPDEPGSELEAAWIGFVSKIARARDEQAALDNLRIGSDPDNENAREIFNKNLDEFHTTLNETYAEFSALKSQMLGGRTWARIKTTLNPTQSDLETYIDRMADYFREKLPALTGQTTAFLGSLLIGGAIMCLALYFFLLDGPKMIRSCQGLSPLDDNHEQELIDEFGKVSRAVVVATLLSALAQGLLAGLGFYVAGFESIFLMTMLTAVLALVPFVGAAAVWIPASLYLYFIDGNMWGAIGLAVYGAIVVSGADNIIKPLILHGQSNLHPLLALLSVLGGVAVLGPIGILVGPMVVAFLQTLLKILQRELHGPDGMLATEGFSLGTLPPPTEVPQPEKPAEKPPLTSPPKATNSNVDSSKETGQAKPKQKQKQKPTPPANSSKKKKKGRK